MTWPPGPDELGDRLQRLETEPLERVVAIGRTVEREGITLDGIALEIRGAGAILHWRARSDEPLVFGPPDVSVADDVDTPYTARSLRSFGTAGQLAGEVAIVPAPPPEAARMRLVVHGFASARRAPADLPLRSSAVRGRWEIEFPLRPEQGGAA